MMPRSSLVVFALSALLVTGCVNRDAQRQAARTQAALADKSIAVSVQPVRLESFIDEFQITGTLQTGLDTQVTAETPGRLIQVLVKEGERVQAGQVIARQDTDDAQTRVRQARSAVNAARSTYQQALADSNQAPVRSSAGVKAAEARVRQAQAALELLKKGAREEERKRARAAVDAARSNMETAKKEMERNEELLRQGAISQSIADQTRNAYQSALAGYEQALEGERILTNGARAEEISQAEQQLRAAQEDLRIAKSNQQLDTTFKMRVDQAQANVESAEEQLQLALNAVSQAVIRAPFSGAVQGRPIQAGTFLGPGTPVLRLVSLDGIYFEGEVPEANLEKVQPGNKIRLTVSATPNVTYEGTVVAYNPLGAEAGRIFKVRASLDTTSELLKPGMFARASVEAGRTAKATTVPVNALVRSGRETFVFVAEGDKAVRKAVKVVIEQRGLAQVEGVTEGQQVVVRGQDKLTDGAAIKVEAPTTKGN